MAKTNFGTWAKDVNWIKVFFVVVIATLLIVVWKKLFGQNGWIATGWGYLEDGAEWTTDKIQQTYKVQKHLMQQGWNELEKRAGEFSDDIKELYQSGSKWIEDLF